VRDFYLAPGDRRQCPPTRPCREMQSVPCSLTFRKITISMTGLDLDSNLEIAIDCMKMGRPVISVLHGDDNAKKATQLRYTSL
jgi:hypothetical protein